MLLRIGGEDQSFKHESCGDWFQNLHTSNQSKEEEEASKSCSKWRTIPSISFTCNWVSPGLRPRLSSLVLGHPQFLLHQSHFWSRPYPPPHLGISHLISSLLLIPNILISLRFWLVFFCGFFFYVCRSLKPRLWSLLIVGFERIRKNARWVVLFYFIFLIFLVYGCLVAGKRKIKRKVGFGIYGCVCFVYWGWESWHWHNRDTGMHEAIEYFESFISMVLFGCSENAERKKIGFW